ncbi:glutamine synthetase beta-grasp domain-containing protein [Cryobacterium sp. MLB-32]|uniref:glutamine synthetase beta-grasp domain-containing protein n=1 Tax=Cryobacterium sp. MLB-32 TaxID=1529318 RepID=UPI000A89B744|nr:glutamine synthetase [Cryobacterium sp. MLB-32]
MDKQRDFVLRTIEERGIKFVRLWFTDVVGTLKSVAIAPAEVEGAFNEGLGFDGSAIEGLTRSFEADVLAPPGPHNLPDSALAWRSRSDRTHVLRHHHP